MFIIVEKLLINILILGFKDRFHYTSWIQVSLQESIKVNQIQVESASSKYSDQNNLTIHHRKY